MFSAGRLNKYVKTDSTLSVAEKLPEELFFEVFKEIIDAKTWKNCRSVCSTWRNAIDNTPKVMKSITIDVLDATTFLESDLATKARSIRFQFPLQNSKEFLEEFFTKIGSTVEKVVFSFREEFQDGTELDRQKLMFTLLLRSSKKLKSLALGAEERKFLSTMELLIAGESFCFLSTIEHLSVNCDQISESQVKYVQDLVLSLTNIKHLQFVLSNNGKIGCIEQKNIFDIVYNQFDKYKERPLLKVSFC